MSILFLSVSPGSLSLLRVPPGAAPADKEHTVLFPVGAGGREQRRD